MLSQIIGKAKYLLRAPLALTNNLSRAKHAVVNTARTLYVFGSLTHELSTFIGVVSTRRTSRWSRTANHSHEYPSYLFAIALSTGVSEPRLLKQVVTATQLGFETGFVGLPSDRSFTNKLKIQRWSSVLVDDQINVLEKIVLAAIHHFTKLLLLFGDRFPSSPRPLRKFTLFLNRVLLSIHWITPPGFFSVWRATRQALSNELVNSGSVRLVIAHDFFTLLPGLYAARLLQVPLLLDVHEYATGQYDTHQFKSQVAPLIRSFQSEFFRDVDYFSVVSPGILQQLILDYPDISNRAHLCRNIPSSHLQTTVSSPSSVNPEDIQILYSGLICAGRGLEQLIKAFKELPVNYSLHLVGPMDETFLNPLLADLNNPERIRIVVHKMVHYEDIISFNNKFDIGYFAQPQYSPQKRFSLPNKFFEYITAGLCLCVDNSFEMATIVQRHDLGIVLTSHHDPIVIADQIKLLDVERIRAYKQNSLSAASHYTWEAETLALSRFLLSC